MGAADSREENRIQDHANYPGYYGGFVTVWVLVWVWNQDRLLAPIPPGAHAPVVVEETAAAH